MRGEDTESTAGAESRALIAERERLLAHARALLGVTLAELADGLGLPVPAGRVRSRLVRTIIERELGAGAGTSRGQDFAELGIELKTVPVDRAWSRASQPRCARSIPSSSPANPGRRATCARS